MEHHLLEQRSTVPCVYFKNTSNASILLFCRHRYQPRLPATPRPGVDGAVVRCRFEGVAVAGAVGVDEPPSPLFRRRETAVACPPRGVLAAAVAADTECIALTLLGVHTAAVRLLTAALSTGLERALRFRN